MRRLWTAGWRSWRHLTEGHRPVTQQRSGCKDALFDGTSSLQLWLLLSETAAVVLRSCWTKNKKKVNNQSKKYQHVSSILLSTIRHVPIMEGEREGAGARMLNIRKKPIPMNVCKTGFTKLSFYSGFSKSCLSAERAASRSSDASEGLHYHSAWTSQSCHTMHPIGNS